MASVVLALWLGVAQAERPCVPPAALEPRAAATLPLVDVARQLERAAPSPCLENRVARSYVLGLLAAERAWRAGGSPESLVAVRARVNELDGLSSESSAASLARVLLLAQMAAAQNETAEMTLLLEQAFALELRLRLSGTPWLPVVSVAEAAGDSWRRVYRYAEAEQAYLKVTPRSQGSRVERALVEVRRARGRSRR